MPNLKLENGFSKQNMVDIAQLVSASDCGSEDRGFESHYPPHEKSTCESKCFFQLNLPLRESEIPESAAL